MTKKIRVYCATPGKFFKNKTQNGQGKGRNKMEKKYEIIKKIDIFLTDFDKAKNEDWFKWLNDAVIILNDCREYIKNNPK